MSRLDPASLHRLRLIGVETWQRRHRPHGVECRNGPTALLRVRLLSGSGDWLLVRTSPWRGEQQQLLDDLRAAIGPERCRFGQWARDSEAGESMDELTERGVRQLLSFGPPPAPLNHFSVIESPTLDELAGSAAARRGLWEKLSRVLES